MNIIGICGGKYGDSQVGKTFVAEEIRNILGFSYISLMDPVKDICKASGHDLTPENIDEACRRGRAISEDYWLNLAMRDIPEDSPGVVLDDLWFENEASFVTNNSGLVLLITRPGVDDDPHREFSPCVTFDNNLTKEDISGNVSTLVSRYFGIMPK